MLLSGGGKGDCLLRIPVIFLGMIISTLLRSSRGESAFSESEETITFSTFFSSFAALSYLEDKVYKTSKVLDIMVDFFYASQSLNFQDFKSNIDNELHFVWETQWTCYMYKVHCEMVDDLLSCGLLHQSFNPQELFACLFLTPVVHSHDGVSFLQLNQSLHQEQHGLLKIIALQKSKDISHFISKYFKISCLQGNLSTCNF